MKSRCLDLADAATYLGKSSRQVRRYVQDGALPAFGGGHGIPYRFRVSDLDAAGERLSSGPYRKSRKRTGRVDADSFGRIVHACELIMQDGIEDGRSTRGHPVEALRGLWMLTPKASARLLRNVFVLQAPTPSDVAEWAADMGSRLDPLELDLVAALFILRPHRGMHLEREEIAVLQAAQDICRMTRPEMFSDLNGVDFHHLRKLIQEVHAGDSVEVRRMCGPRGELPELEELRGQLVALTRKFRKRYRGRDRIPNGNELAGVLGMHSNQVTRLIDRLYAKLGIAGIQQLLMRLGYDDQRLPQAWQFHAERKRRIAAAYPA